MKAKNGSRPLRVPHRAAGTEGEHMATMSEVQALLEDGPELPSQLAEWLEMDLAALTLLLERMRIPQCDRCSRRFLPGVTQLTRFCSRECDGSQSACGCVSISRSGPDASRLQRDSLSREWPQRAARRRDEPEFEVVWNGVGPLPGAGGAAGLGSTLSGIHFSMPKIGFSMSKRG
jgi:hypothetical protein